MTGSLTIFCIMATILLANQAGGTPIETAHSESVITYLWWALGIMGTFVAAVSGGTSIWMLQRILAHDKQIAIIKARCAMHEDEEGDED